MAFWSGETLKTKLDCEKLIQPYDPNAIDCAAYTLHVGKEIYISPDGEVSAPNRHTKQMLKPEEGFAIPPGQFAFLMTTETVKVPATALALISIKAKTKFKGLINISGFHVDPGYEGKLLFAVLNAGPKPLHLNEGQPLFLIWYANLDQETEEKKNPEDGLGGILPEYIDGISGEILSLQSLSAKIEKLSSKIDWRITFANIVLGALITAIIGAFFGGFSFEKLVNSLKNIVKMMG